MLEKKEKKEKKKSKRPTEQKPIPLESMRIKTLDLHVYKKAKQGWVKANVFFPEAMQVIKLFKAHKNFDVLIDKKDPRFLKGMVLKNGNPVGARINMLPDGRLLDKAFSLFAPELTIHDEETNDHWDVLYKNKGGTYSYVYTLDKKEQHRKSKYRAVHEFAKRYNELAESVIKALYDDEDHLAMPMYTLLKTMMRIGNETYYKAHGHKGLTTIKKHNIQVKKDEVTFSYFGKDGVPFLCTEKFPKVYIKRLKRKLRPLKDHSFVFTHHETGHPLSEVYFKHAFEKYCGKPFYPHIVRSYYATQRVQEFLKNNRSPSKEEVREFLKGIAAKLGHKKFDKKNEEWKEDYTVTINHYVEPKLAERLRNFYK